MANKKFRAWDKKSKKWIYSTDISIYVFWSYVGYKNLTIYQYIGIKDKNGNEIYEGDIVKNSYGVIGTVGYFNELGFDGLGASHPGFYCKEWFSIGDDGELSYYYELNNEAEIVGNIYENGNLVENRMAVLDSELGAIE